MPERADVVVSHCERFRVGWIDTDASHRIHHTAAFRWVEATEISLFRKLGLLGRGVGHWPRRHIEADFVQALAFDQEVDVLMEVAAVGTSSVTFAWRITRDGETAIEGRHTVVQVDKDGRPLPLADDSREAFLGGRQLLRAPLGST